jgi:hypothetical protein
MVTVPCFSARLSAKRSAWFWLESQTIQGIAMYKMARALREENPQSKRDLFNVYRMKKPP